MCFNVHELQLTKRGFSTVDYARRLGVPESMLLDRAGFGLTGVSGSTDWN